MSVTKSATVKLFQRVCSSLSRELPTLTSHNLTVRRSPSLQSLLSVHYETYLNPPPHTHTVPPRAATFTHAWENTHTSPRTTVNHLQGANKKLRPLERGQECVQSQWKNKLGRERGGRRVRWSNHCPLPTQEEDMQYREHYEEVSSVLIGPLIFLFCPTVPYDLSFLIFVHRMNEPNRLWEETYLLVFLCIINNLQEIHDLVFKQ